MTREQMLVESENLSKVLLEVLTNHEKSILRVLLEKAGA